MGKLCNNCGYERKIEDIAPYYECPSCGMIYAKSDKALEEDRKRKYAESLNLQKPTKTIKKNTVKGKISKYAIISAIYLLFVFLIFRGGGWSIIGGAGLIIFFIFVFLSYWLPSR